MSWSRRRVALDDALYTYVTPAADGDVDQSRQRHDAGRHHGHHHRHQPDWCDRRDVRRDFGASITVVNATTITAITPAHTAGAVDVVVTTSGGTGTGASLYTYVTPAPTVTSIGPTNGTTLGGTTVTITGTNLTGATAVTFGGVPATSFMIVDANTIIAVAPAHAAGAVDVVVTTPGGTATATYTYVTPAPTVASVDPTSGTTVGGTTVTITGTNLTGATAVTFGGVPATSFTVVNATTITAVTPAHAAGAFDVVVTTPGGYRDDEPILM